MSWAVTLVTFVSVGLIVLALAYAFSSTTTVPITDRLRRLWHPPATARTSFREKQKERLQRVLSDMGRILPASPKQASRTERLMARAGFRRPEAVAAIHGAKVLLPAIFVGLAYFTNVYQSNPLFILGLAGLAGYMAPEFWLTSRIKKRQQVIRLSLPDFLDLLVICVEAGLGLDQALIRVSQELRVAHPQLCDELDLSNAEVRVGRSRVEALRELGLRTGVDEIKSLVAMLLQTERFGTSVAQSLRVHSEELRTRRRQRAEELAAKTTVKMVPALVFFIMPALFIVILGPAAISLARSLGPIFQK
jgi:tight adherence protein C